MSYDKGAKQFIVSRWDLKTAAMRKFSPEAKGERREGRPARIHRQVNYLKANPALGTIDKNCFVWYN